MAYDTRRMWISRPKPIASVCYSPPVPPCVLSMILVETENESLDFVGLAENDGQTIGYSLHVLCGRTLKCKRQCVIAKDFRTAEPTKLIVCGRHVAIKYGNVGFAIWDISTREF
jgi:hypothetical protein